MREVAKFLIDYEIASSRWSWLIGADRFQELAARYYVRKVTRKMACLREVSEAFRVAETQDRYWKAMRESVEVDHERCK